MVPRELEICATATIRARGVRSFRYSSSKSSPRSFIGMTFNVAPDCSARICQGTMFEWCSMAETRISSPAFTFSLPKLEIGEHTSELQSPVHLVCRLLLEKKKET